MIDVIIGLTLSIAISIAWTWLSRRLTPQGDDEFGPLIENIRSFGGTALILVGVTLGAARFSSGVRADSDVTRSHGIRLLVASGMGLASLILIAIFRLSLPI